MKKNGSIAIIGTVIIILFLIFVFYSKGQWVLIEHNPQKETGLQASAVQDAGQVRFQILPKNETNCADNIDEDYDNLTDCSDPDCYVSEAC